MNKKQITMVTVALMLGNVMAGLDGTITNTAIPSFQRYMGSNLWDGLWQSIS